MELSVSVCADPDGRKLNAKQNTNPMILNGLSGFAVKIEGGCADRSHTHALPREGRWTKKEEFPGFMGNMLPGNSFPQICVVSGNEFLLVTVWVQEYEGLQHLSNAL